VFAKKFLDYNDKFLYELYYNIELQIVLVCIQTEFFSLYSIEPIINQNSDNIYHSRIEYFGVANEFYNIALNKFNIKLHCRHINEFDIDYNQVTKIYEIFIQEYEKIVKLFIIYYFYFLYFCIFVYL